MKSCFGSLQQRLHDGVSWQTLFAFYVLAVVPIAFVSCHNSARPPGHVRPVKVEAAGTYGVARESYSGVVAPKEFVNLAFRMGGPLVAVNVVEGQSVKAGETIAGLDPADYRLDMEAKRAAFLTAGQQMERAGRLLERNAVSKQDYESLAAQYENARAAYENSRSILEQTTLRAPFDGFIQERYVENYQEVTPGQKIVCLVNPNKLQIQATLPDRALSYITSSPTLWVEFDAYRGVRFSGAITEYVQSSPDGSGVPIFVEVTDPRFNLRDYRVAIGFSCRVELAVDLAKIRNSDKAGASDGPNVGSVDGPTVGGPDAVVPLSGVVQMADGNKYVFIYDTISGRVRQQRISGGEIVERSYMVVTRGVAPGDLVVSAGAARLADGERVTLLESAAK